jgi:cyclophilin family peptidyl-prolyl cis-trans isomerase
MTLVSGWLIAMMSGLAGQTTPEAAAIPPGPEKPLSGVISVELRAPRTTVPVGGEVLVEFSVQNRTSEPITLTVPGALPGKEKYAGMGLPLEHVFSGPNYRGLEVATEENPVMGDRVTRKPEFPVPPMTLMPFGTVGLRFDVARFYPGLHQSGIYTLRWRPYGGAVEAAPLTIRVVQYKQVVMDTDMGSVTMRLLYDKAPKTVENFLELVEQRFYNGKSIHRVRPNVYLQGGSPTGDDGGKRPDGATLAPEFNDTPFELGTVAMALAEPDEHSASCQFFIALARIPAWDSKYTAFAQVVGPESLATLRKMSEVEADAAFRPKKPLKIQSMSAQDVPFLPLATTP